MQISSQDIAISCGFAGLLPLGRLNGFNNMIELIKSEALVKESYFKKHRQESLRLQPSDDFPFIDDVSHRYERIGKDEVAVLLSGGVDSSLALYEVLAQGAKVRAFYLKIWLEDEVAHLSSCPWEEDLQYAQQVCEQLKVPLETVSLQREYWDEVVAYTLAEAQAGRTPNPDIMCNSR